MCCININIPVLFSFDSLFRQPNNSKNTLSKEYTNYNTPYKEYTNNATLYKEYTNNATLYKENTNNTTPSKVEVVDLESDEEDNAPIHPGSAAARYILLIYIYYI